jgi:hypothetical protein
LTIEVIQYNFEEHPEQFSTYFTKVMKLVIISKLNCLETNRLSVKYFQALVSRIDGCDFHSVKYGKPMLFTSFLGYEFNYHTVHVSLKTVASYAIEISIESIIQEFVKIFDELSSDTREIKWNVAHSPDTTQKLAPLSSPSEEQPIEEEDTKSSKTVSSSEDSEEVKTIFHLLDAFVGSLYILMNLSSRDESSLYGKNVEIKDVSLTRRILNIEILVNGDTIILDCNSKSRKRVFVSLDNDAKIGETIKNLMLQNNAI